MSNPPRHFAHLPLLALLFVFVAAGCSANGPTLDDGTAAAEGAGDPTQDAITVTTAFDQTIQLLTAGYDFDRVNYNNGVEVSRLIGRNLGGNTQATATAGDVAIEALVVDGVGWFRAAGGQWSPLVDLPTDHDPLAPMFAATQVSVVGAEISFGYPGATLGLLSEWVTVTVTTEPNAVSLQATDGTMAVAMRLVQAPADAVIVAP